MTLVPLGRAEQWRSEMLTGLWGLTGLLAVSGTVLHIEGELAWCPVFGMDGPVLPMIVLLAFVGGVSGSGHSGMACVLSGLAFLALSPLVFGLLAGTALVLLVRREWIGVCLPMAIIPASVPVDSPLFTPALCIMVLLLGKAIAVQNGPSALLPGSIGLFLLGRLLTESGVLHPVCQIFLFVCGSAVAVMGCVQALSKSSSAASLVSGLVTSGFGALVVVLVLAFGTTLGGAEQFRAAVLLASGAPFLSFLSLLWLCQNTSGELAIAEESTSLYVPLLLRRREAYILLAGALLMVSGLPPLGNFSVLWCLVGAAQQAARAVRPIQAFAVIALLVIVVCVMILGILSLLRLALAVVRSDSVPEERSEADSASVFAFIPAVVCLFVAAAIAVLPGIWLVFSDHFLAGAAERPFYWSKSITIWFLSTPVSFTPLYCVMTLLLCAGGLLVFGAVFKVCPFPMTHYKDAFWQQGAPFEQMREKLLQRGVPSDSQFQQTLWVFMGLQNCNVSVRSGWKKCIETGLPLYRLLLKGSAWCETQGTVLILFFLGAGLFFELFAG